MRQHRRRDRQRARQRRSGRRTRHHHRFDSASVRGGTVADNGNGTFTYTPAAGFTGTDSFTYTIADADGEQSAATVPWRWRAARREASRSGWCLGRTTSSRAASGSMSLTGSDLELVNDGSN